MSELTEVMEQLRTAIKQEKTELARGLEARVKELLNTMPIIDEFDSKTSSATIKFWKMFSETVSILQGYIHAERTGDWSRHLEHVQLMLPYIAAAGHYKYATCLPKYLNDMRALSQSFVLHMFMNVSLMENSQFTVQKVGLTVYGLIWHLNRHIIVKEKLPCLKV